nr:TPA_inf: conotoxin precursor M [Conus judaeus]
MSKLGVALLIFMVLFPLEALEMNEDQSADRRAEKWGGVLHELYKNLRRAMERKTTDQEIYMECRFRGCEYQFCCR